jgi:hypothetical protein
MVLCDYLHRHVLKCDVRSIVHFVSYTVHVLTIEPIDLTLDERAPVHGRILWLLMVVVMFLAY